MMGHLRDVYEAVDAADVHHHSVPRYGLHYAVDLGTLTQLGAGVREGLLPSHVEQLAPRELDVLALVDGEILHVGKFNLGCRAKAADSRKIDFEATLLSLDDLACHAGARLHGKS